MLPSQGSNHYFDKEPFDYESMCSNEEVENFNPFYNGKSSSSSEEDIRHQCEQRRHRNHRDFNIKTNILDFEGLLQPNEFVDWLHIVM